MTATAQPLENRDTGLANPPGPDGFEPPSPAGWIAGEPDPFCARIARLASILLDVPVAFVSSFEADGRVLRGAVDRDGYDIPHRLPAVECPDGTRAPYAPMSGIHSYMEHPLHTPGAVAVGALCVADRRARDWSDAERELLSELAALLVHQRALPVPGRNNPAVRDVSRRLSSEITGMADAVATLAERAEQHDDPRLHRYAAASRKRMATVLAAAESLRDEAANDVRGVHRFDLRQAVNRSVREAVFVSGRGDIVTDLGSVPWLVAGDQFEAESAITQLITAVLHHSADGRARITLRPGDPGAGRDTEHRATLAVTAVGSALPVASVARIISRFEGLRGAAGAQARSNLRFVDGKIAASSPSVVVRSNPAGTLVVTHWPTDRA